MKRVAIVTALATIALCSGCTTSEWSLVQIAVADSLSVIAPDSALGIISEVNPRRIYGSADRASYGLTYSRVMDFCDIKTDRDTLIAPAVDYYLRRDMPAEAGVALYYLALTHEYGHRDSLALHCLVEAEKFASRAGDYHALTITCGGLGRLYESQLLYDRAAEVYVRAAKAAEAAGERRNMMYCYINSSNNYVLQLDYDRSLHDDSLALALAVELCDTVWIKMTLSSIAKTMYYKTENPRPSLELLQYNYRTYYNGEPPWDDYSFLYQLYEAMGRPEEAMKYLNMDFENRDRFPLEAQPGMYILLSQAARRRGQYDKAFDYYDKVLELDDSINRQVEETSLLAAEHRYRFDLQESENARAMAQKRAQIAELVAVIVVAICLAFYFLIRLVSERRTKRREIEELVAAFENASTSKNMLLAELDEHVERERRLKQQLETRFSEVRAIVNKYYTFGNDERRLRKEIEEFMSPDSFDDEMYATIEAVVDAKNSDVIAQLRSSITLKTEEMHLLLLVYAGFTNEEISVIMGVSVTNAAVRKTRLRQRLSEFIASSPDFAF